MFLVFEGIDGSGTTTQVEKLADFLGKRAVVTAEPTDGKIGKITRDFLRGREKLSPRALQFLFCADRAEHFQNTIAPAKKKGKIILCDRFMMSTVAYAGLSGDEKLFESVASFFPKPTMTIFLRIDPKKALSRIERRGEPRDIFEQKESLEKIAQIYEQQINRLPEEKKIIFDSGKMGAEEIAEEIQKWFFTHSHS